MKDRKFRKEFTEKSKEFKFVIIVKKNLLSS